MPEIDSRTALEKALLNYVPPDREAFAKDFLSGLAVDELLFLAGFFGSCRFIRSGIDLDTWGALRYRVQAFCGGEEDRNHKLMVLDEFAGWCEFLDMRR